MQSWGLGRGHCPLPRNFFRFWVWKWRLFVHSGCLFTRRGGHGPSRPPLDPPVPLSDREKSRIDHAHPYAYMYISWKFNEGRSSTFWDNWSPREPLKFSKFCSESFHRLTDRRVVFKFRQIWQTWNRWHRALFTGWKTKFRLPFKLSLLRLSRLNSARSSPQQCTQSALDFTQIVSISAEL